MNLICIDFETFYDSKVRDPELAPKGYTLKHMTTEEYVRHPWFDVIGVAVRYGERRWWLTEEQFSAFVRKVNWAEVDILAHHTHYEALILSHYYGVKPRRWLDTLSMARAMHAHETPLDLGSLMQFYNVGEKGTYAKSMDGVRGEDMTPDQLAEYGEYAIGDVDGTWDIFHKMVPEYPEQELAIIDMTIRMFSEPAFVADEEMLADFLERESKRKADMFKRLGIDKKTFTSSEKFANLLRSVGVEPPMKKSPKWEDGVNEKWIYAFAKTDPGMQMLLEDEDDEIRWMAEARVAAKSTLDISRTARFLKLGANGRQMPVYLVYCAAHTTRWGGGDKMNWQNLRRVNKRKPDQGVIKRSVMAEGNKVVLRADSSQIEARGNGWFSFQDDLVADFASGVDVYSKLASKLYGRKVDRRIVLPDGTEPDFVPGFVGKTCTLGLGYGMGFYKLAMEFLKGALGGPPLVFKQTDLDLFGIDPIPFLNNKRKMAQVKEMPSRLDPADLLLHCIVCDYIVTRWREENKKIMDMQRFLNDVIIPAIAVGDNIPFGPGGCVHTFKNGVMLPNGLALHYHRLHQIEKPAGREWVYQIRPGQWTKLYGGLLLENLIQALSRIIIGMQALLIHQTYPVKTLTHDEIVTVVELNKADAGLEYLLMIMSLKPDWASGWPLTAEGGYDIRYGDAK